MDQDLLITGIVALAALSAVAFTVVPVLPGTFFVPLGALVVGLVADWDELAWWFWAAQIVLVVLYLLVDNVGQALGVRRAGGTRAAMAGGAMGVVAGPFVLAVVLGPLALLLGPPVGAVAGTLAGEAWARRRQPPAADPASAPSYRSIGTVALVAFVLTTVVKLSVVSVQIVLLAWVAR